MKKECEFCKIPNRKLNTNDYFEKLSLWKDYVSQGIFKFIKGDTSLENLEEEIYNENKYVYYHYFECKCGKKIKTGICIRSSVPLIEYIEN